MKKFIKGLALGLALTAATVAPTFAQDDPCKPIYDNFTAKYRGKTLDEKKSAVASGEELIAKCSSVEAYSAENGPISFVNKQLPKLKKEIENMEAQQIFEAAAKDPKNANVDAAFAAGKKVMEAIPAASTDVMIALAMLGHDRSAEKHYSDTINYAKQVIQKIEGGAQITNWGVWALNLKKNEGQAASKDNTLSWMNFFIGNIMTRQNMKKDALSYLYKSTQYNNGTKTFPGVYGTIGDYYKDEFNRIDDERTKIAEEAKALAGDDPKKKELVDKVNELLALQKGYADRMIDAYARAYNLAGTDKAYKDALYNTMKVLHNVRFDGKGPALDAYISEITKKPMPDPTSTVTPIAETSATTSTTSTNPSANVPATTPSTTPKTTNSTTATTVKPTTATKPATNGTTTAGTTKTINGATTKPAPTKKPAPKKKGTR